jgi:FkbM family methyltransferase
MISYAQNHEDALLARALADTESGFYIDVGAYDPTVGSVTRHFYDLGWHGINIEPQPAYAAKLRHARPRDLTLEVALSDRAGSAILYDVSVGDGVATIDDGQARQFGDEYDIIGKSPVPVTTLAEVCARHCEANTPISFLKVDVEGHERAVLAGGDWTRWQPRIVLVEATEPMTKRPSERPWEPILLGAGYVFVLFDGLNRWYARHDERRIIDLLTVPVNVFDDYQPYAWVSRVAELEAGVASLLATSAEATADGRYRALILAFESLQERYRRLSDALQQERTSRSMELVQLADLAREVGLLGERAPD